MSKKNRKGAISPILLVVVIFLTGGLIYYFQAKDVRTNINYSSSKESSAPSPTSTDSVVLCQPGEWITCKFNKYPLEFQYPNTLTLNENIEGEVNVIGLFKNDAKIMTIRPEQYGYGIENPDIETSSTTIMIDGKKVVINEKEVLKTKLYNKAERTTHYITVIQYPNKRDYLIMVPSFFDDNAENKQLGEIYDKIISTFKFTN